MKRALVIGASRGLGAHVAKRLAAEGWDVTGTGRRSREEAELTDEVDYIPADLSDPATIERLGAWLAGNEPDLVVHNAVSYAPTRNLVLEDMEALFRVNTLAPYLLLREHLASTDRKRWCSCIVVNSDAIYHASQSTAVYAATKAALRVLTTSLAQVAGLHNASVSTLLLGPLADDRKVSEIRRIAEQRGLDQEGVVHAYLKRSNPSYVIDALIDLEPCFQSILHIASLGGTANGMLCRLDGGSAGSLV